MPLYMVEISLQAIVHGVFTAMVHKGDPGGPWAGLAGFSQDLQPVGERKVLFSAAQDADRKSVV